METSTVCWGHIRIMEKKMETIMVEKKMETTEVWGVGLCASQEQVVVWLRALRGFGCQCQVFKA